MVDALSFARRKGGSCGFCRAKVSAVGQSRQSVTKWCGYNGAAKTEYCAYQTKNSRRRSAKKFPLYFPEWLRYQTSAIGTKQGGEMLQEFKDFIAKGNVMDMAVGIIIGAAFTAIVTSLVDDLINPIIGLFLGGLDFSGLKYVLGEGEGAASFNYGNFIMAIINFLIIAWVVFLLVKMVNRVKDAATAPEEEAAPEPAGPTQEELLGEIRDLLKR